MEHVEAIIIVITVTLLLPVVYVILKAWLYERLNK